MYLQKADFFVLQNVHEITFAEPTDAYTVSSNESITEVGGICRLHIC
jgi:hypothetical protein